MSNLTVYEHPWLFYIITFLGYIFYSDVLRLLCLWAMGLTLCQSTGKKRKKNI